MTLRETPDHWYGDDPADLTAFVLAEADEYPNDVAVTARCAGCAGTVFLLEADESTTAFRRTCPACDDTVFMLDSAENWPPPEEAEEQYICECVCGNELLETAVGFSFYDEGPEPDIRWVSIACRCPDDGLIAYYGSWKIGYGPSHHLVHQV